MNSLRPLVWDWWQAGVYIVPTATTTYILSPDSKIFRVPTRVLVEIPSYNIIAFGEEAREVEHAGVGKSRVIQPFSSQEVFDEGAAKVFLRSIFRLALGSRYLLKPRVVMSLPSSVTPFMRELWWQVLAMVGARDIITVHPLLAIGYGVGLPLETEHGYVTGSIDAHGANLGLIAFGHVQHEVMQRWEKLPQSKAELGERLQQLWKELLDQVPVEFLAVLQQEGLVVAVDDDNSEWAKLFSQQLKAPVVLVPRTVEVMGLETALRAQEE